ncbi:virulence RhuM family protein [Holdemanella porci]|uniref:virulence RhuM family protein n=1 Tax=Holdemanella porci TaxID=2652276 RepID=UPI0022E4340A|nr:RhuM family protein [Holdemanella porci]
MINEIIKFVNDDFQLDVTVSPNEETVWLTQKQMAELFDVKSQAITRHLKSIYNDEELFKEATCSKMEQIQMEGSRKITRKMDFYNLDAIIAVGYRVNSKKVTSFRRWATSILKKYMIKTLE